MLHQNAGVVALLTRALLLVATVACALFNGRYGRSAAFDSIDQMLGISLRGYPYMTRAIIYYYVTPAAIALMTLMVAGIPAAVYERVRGLRSSSVVSLGIWLVAAAFLAAAPDIMRALSGNELR